MCVTWCLYSRGRRCEDANCLCPLEAGARLCQLLQDADLAAAAAAAATETVGSDTDNVSTSSSQSEFEVTFVNRLIIDRYCRRDHPPVSRRTRSLDTHLMKVGSQKCELSLPLL